MTMDTVKTQFLCYRIKKESEWLGHIATQLQTGTLTVEALPPMLGKIGDELRQLSKTAQN